MQQFKEGFGFSDTDIKRRSDSDRLSIREYDQVQTALYRWMEFERRMGRPVDATRQREVFNELKASARQHRSAESARIDVMSPADRFNPVRARSRLMGDPNVGPQREESGKIPAPTKIA
jgi:hypothetical protein